MFSNTIVLEMLEYLDCNLFRKVSIAELSSHFHYNKDYLMRLFKKEIGSTIMDYMNYKRVFLSLDSLKDSSNSILNISLTYGFYSQEYYSEIFYKLIGVSPSCYRKYLNHDRSILEETFDLIQSRIVFLYNYFKKIQFYQKNLPPKNSIISLSIFK